MLVPCTGDGTECSALALVLMVGGDSPDGWLDDAEVLDLELHSWVERSPLPRLRFGFAVAAVGQRVYVLGGTDKDELNPPSSHRCRCDFHSGEAKTSRLLSSVEVFDFNSGEWMRGAPHMLQARTGAVAACVLGEVYVAGGNGGHLDGYLSSSERFWPGSGTPWEPLPPMRGARADAAATCIESRMFVVGGRDGTNVLRSAECFDMETSIWAPMPPMLTPRAHCSATAVGGSVLVMGGENDATCLGVVERYDPESGTRCWEALAPMAVPRSAAGAVVVGGAVYVFGGRCAGKILDAAERFDPDVGAWVSLPAMPMPRAAFGIGVCGKDYIVL